MTKHVLSGSSSKTSKTLNFTCYTYNIQNKCIVSESCMFKLQDINTESDIHTAEAILDFIELRSLAVVDANMNHVIEYLCTLWFVYFGRWLSFFLHLSFLCFKC